jgi:(p)ppGpp synthase/HD superfamily hydrolase
MDNYLEPQLAIAISVAACGHESQFDRGGNPYILHTLRVMNAMGDDIVAKIAAVLHDICEDTEHSLVTLRGRGIINEPALHAIDLLTKQEGQTYAEYIIGVKSDPIASKVKMADIQDNSLLTRLKGIRPKDMTRALKYHAAYMYLDDRISLEQFKETLSDIGEKVS